MASASRKVLTLDDRLKVIDLGKTHSAREIATLMGVSKTQIQNIWLRKERILDESANNVSGSLKRKRKPKNEELDTLCTQWFHDTIKRGRHMSGPLIQTQARRFAQELHLEGFRASNGWLGCFLKRNNLQLSVIGGERDLSRDVVEDFRSKLPLLCSGYEPRDIFTMNKSGLFYRDSRTERSYHLKGKDCVGGQRSKERITVSLCASMIGEKLKPLVIGKFAKPRAFNRVNPETLPLYYRYNRKAWMTTEIMCEWLQLLNAEMVRKNRNILLFLDISPSHPHMTFSNVRICFFPPGTTFVVQPMNQGIIQAAKMKFRRHQLSYIVAKLAQDPHQKASVVLKDINILQAINWFHASWTELDPVTIQNCFTKCHFSAVKIEKDADHTPEDDTPISLLLASRQLYDCEFNQLVDIDSSLPTDSPDTTVDWNQPATDILEHLADEGQHMDSDSDCVEAEPDAIPVISAATAASHLDDLIGFALTVDNPELINIIFKARNIVDDMTAKKCTVRTKSFQQ